MVLRLLDTVVTFGCKEVRIPDLESCIQKGTRNMV